MFKYVLSIFPSSFLTDAFIAIFSTRFGKSGYLKDALLELILISKCGIVVSLFTPLIFPFTLKFPVVATFSMFLEYSLGITARKSLKSEPGFSKEISISCPSSSILT